MAPKKAAPKKRPYSMAGLTQAQQQKVAQQQSIDKYAMTSARTSFKAAQAAISAAGGDPSQLAAFGRQPIASTSKSGKQKVVGYMDYTTGKAVRNPRGGEKALKAYKQTVKKEQTNVGLFPLGGGQGGAVEEAEAAAASFVPYAEADVATTAYRRAQGKAYGRGTGEYSRGSESSPPEGGEEGESVVAPLMGKKKKGTRKVTSRTKSGKKVVRTRRGGKVVKKTVGGKKVAVKRKPPKKR